VPWDRERYRLDVLEPARRRGNVPPDDLYVRYGLARGVSDPAAFAEQIGRVRAFWLELKSRRTYERLAAALLTAHADLERHGRLTLRGFAESQAQARRQQLARLARLADAEAGAATHVGQATVIRLREALGNSVTDAEAAEALARAGVRIVAEFPRLPASPHPKLAALVQHVRVLGLQLSAEAVFGDAVRRGFRMLRGFRLADGRPLDEAAIAAERHRVDALPHSDPAKAHTENVLATLSGAARSGDLDALLLSEVVELLRPLADRGFLQRAIATQARELGLDQEEAGLTAAAMLARDAVEDVRQQAAADLAAGNLRSAQRKADELPAGDPLRERVAALAAEVAALSRRAGLELDQGRGEQAAGLLAEAARKAIDDPDLPGRLAAIPPPPPPAAEARIAGEHLLITWQPSPVQAGRARYRVVRAQDRAPVSPADGAIVVSQTERHDVTDADAPAGARLAYSVFAGRGGDAWSRPATTQPVLFTPEVADVSVMVGESSVAASWRVPAGADGVVAVRGEGRVPKDPAGAAAVTASRTGFTDTGLRTGAEYFYLIVVSYATPRGRTCRSPGTVIRAVPEPEPEAVTDLEVRVLDSGTPRVEATWTPPRYGQVRLMPADEPPPWPAGTRLSPEDMAGLRAAPGMPRRGPDGRELLELELPYGRHHLLPVTATGSAVIAGRSAPAWLAEPVRELAAVRLDDKVRLGWVWPDEATDAEVRWLPDGRHRCSRRVYDDEGGLTLTVGRAETQIEVRPVYTHSGGQHTGPAAQVQVPGRGVRVDYRIRSRRRPYSRQHVIELDAAEPTRLPALVVVRSAGRYPPDEPGEGETLARAGPRPITPGLPVTMTVAARGPGWLACFVDPEACDPDAGDIVLCPPPGDEMRIR
jgi:hypothetical protein